MIIATSYLQKHQIGVLKLNASSHKGIGIREAFEMHNYKLYTDNIVFSFVSFIVVDIFTILLGAQTNFVKVDVNEDGVVRTVTTNNTASI